ncbi:MAG: hypothetical protein J6W14_00045, partial [Clostridia bacterium]|nr:hypothetical protein [Clostridia bacterium]
MKGKKKVALFVALCLAIAMMVGLTVFASPVSAEDLNGWHQTEDGKWYYYESGSACADGIYWIDEEHYYFDADGVMANGEWLLLTEGWYYAQPG